MQKRTGWFLALILVIFISVSIPVQAQTESRVLLDALDLTDFPQISAYIDVRGGQGYFVSGLPDNAATILEDEQPLLGIINEVRPGAQIVIAYGGGESFGIFNLEARTRYEVLTAWLSDWAVNQAEADLDDLSLLAPEGVLLSHLQEPSTLNENLLGYQPDFALQTGSLETLSTAIDMALDPLPKVGMGRAVLFLTQGVPEEQQSVLQSLIDRAAQGGVRINIGFVNSANVFDSNDAIRLQTAAMQTGGQYFSFSSDEPLPDLTIMFESSRRAYLLQYRSQINTSGLHTISVVVNTDQGELASQPVSFESSINAPIPVFVSPPTTVTRAVPPGESPSLESLSPDQQPLEMLVQFPDGIARQITRTALYINDALAIENVEPPFETVTLDLTPYKTNETLFLRLEVSDELGLTGSSVDTPLEIIVEEPRTDLLSMLGSNITILIIGVIGLAGAVLLLVLVLAGRLRPRSIGERRKKRSETRDPVTQPLSAKQTEVPETKANVLERLSRRLPSPRIPWPSRTRPTTDPYAYLVRVSEDGETNSETLFPVTVTELTFGADTKQAVIALDNPAIEPLHARLWRDDDGLFHLQDSGSTAGTYLNYAPVSTEGAQVEHGDLIHIAKVGYRFTLSQPTQTRQPTVVALKQKNKGEDQGGDE